MKAADSHAFDGVPLNRSNLWRWYRRYLRSGIWLSLALYLVVASIAAFAAVSGKVGYGVALLVLALPIWSWALRGMAVLRETDAGLSVNPTFLELQQYHFGLVPVRIIVPFNDLIALAEKNSSSGNDGGRLILVRASGMSPGMRELLVKTYGARNVLLPKAVIAIIGDGQKDYGRIRSVWDFDGLTKVLTSAANGRGREGGDPDPSPEFPGVIYAFPESVSARLVLIQLTAAVLILQALILLDLEELKLIIRCLRDLRDRQSQMTDMANPEVSG